MRWPGTARTRATVLAMAATSGSRRFDGHKAAIVVDTGSQLITAVEVIAGQRSGQPGGAGTGGGERGQHRCAGG